MATYAELFALTQNGALRDRVSVACMIAAEKIRVEAVTIPNNAARRVWARRVLENPDTAALSALRAALVQNATSSVASLTAASDAVLQTAIDAAVDLLTA